MPSGFVDRYKGKGYQPAGWLQQIGSGGAASPGGGQINSTGAASTGAQLSTVANTEQTLLSYVLPAKTLDRAGRNVLITAFGTFSTFNGGAKTAKLYFGSEAVSVQNSTTVTALQAWWLQLNVFQTAAASTAPGTNAQVILGQSILSSAHQGASYTAGAENTVVNSTIKVTGISSSPTASDPGDVTAYSLQVEGLN